MCCCFDLDFNYCHVFAAVSFSACILTPTCVHVCAYTSTLTSLTIYLYTHTYIYMKLTFITMMQPRVRTRAQNQALARPAGLRVILLHQYACTACTHACMFVYIQVLMYIYTYTYIHTYIHTIYIHMHMYMFCTRTHNPCLQSVMLGMDARNMHVSTFRPGRTQLRADSTLGCRLLLDECLCTHDRCILLVTCAHGAVLWVLAWPCACTLRQCRCCGAGDEHAGCAATAPGP
jgi:hypothetical protein